MQKRKIQVSKNDELKQPQLFNIHEKLNVTSSATSNLKIKDISSTQFRPNVFVSFSITYVAFQYFILQHLYSDLKYHKCFQEADTESLIYFNENHFDKAKSDGK